MGKSHASQYANFGSLLKNWYKVKKRVLIKVKLIYFFK